MKKSLEIFYHIIFWIWNSSFLLLVYLGILPLALPSLVAAIAAGELPIPFLLSMLGIVGVPTVCTFVGLKWLRQRPTALMRLFYGVDAVCAALSKAVCPAGVNNGKHLAVGGIFCRDRSFCS